MKDQAQYRERAGSFDSIYASLCDFFEGFKDFRSYNITYSLSDFLKSGFAIYSLKCPSLLAFQKRTAVEDSNLSQIYGIGDVPSDNRLRQGLDEIHPGRLRQGFQRLFKRLKNLGILTEYTYWRNHTILSIDGVEHFCSKKVSCPHCMKRKHRDGSTSNYHSMLGAVMVHPEQREVFVLDCEPIVKQDGAEKNDCERNAAKRLLSEMKQNYPKQFMVLVMDALYATAPCIEQIQAHSRWQYVINVKPDSHKSLFRQFENRDRRGQVKWHQVEDDKGVHKFGYSNGLALNESATHIRTNMLYYEFHPHKGKKQTFTWITSIRMTKSNVYKIMRMGRSRWKIENETFNTLKNQGYHFEHNFGHGFNFLCSVFAILMMLAFTVDQIQQHACDTFQQLWEGLGTKVKLWESLRASFKFLDCQSMEAIFFKMAQFYRIRIE